MTDSNRRIILAGRLMPLADGKRSTLAFRYLKANQAHGRTLLGFPNAARSLAFEAIAREVTA